MKRRPPTKRQRTAARKVLAYYCKQAERLVLITDQETPSEWWSVLDRAKRLLKTDPKVIMDEYLAEYTVGR